MVPWWQHPNLRRLSLSRWSHLMSEADELNSNDNSNNDDDKGQGQGDDDAKVATLASNRTITERTNERTNYMTNE